MFAPKPSSIEQVRGGSWGWDEEAAVEQQVPDWNPRTGFMGSAAEREARMASGSTAGTSEAKSGPAPAAVEVKALLFTAPVEGDAPLPAVSKDQVHVDPCTTCGSAPDWQSSLTDARLFAGSVVMPGYRFLDDGPGPVPATICTGIA